MIVDKKPEYRENSNTDSHLFLLNLDHSLTDMSIPESRSADQRPNFRLADEKTQDNHNTRDLVIVFADIVGSTGLYERLGDRLAHQLVASTLQAMKNAVDYSGGRVIKTIGDELLCTFTTADEAAQGAINIQKAIASHEEAGQEPVAIRIGMNYGSVVESGDDVFGNCVNVAARLVSLASPHQILTTVLFVERLSTDLRKDARELQRVGIRGRADYVAVWALLWRSEEEARNVVFHERGQYQGMQLTLEFRGRKWDLGREGDFITLGRDETNHVLLDNPFSSRLHARVELRNGKFVLIDLSTNGTFIRVESGQLTSVTHEEFVLEDKGIIAFNYGSLSKSEVVTFSVHSRSSGRRTLTAPVPVQLVSTSEHFLPIFKNQKRSA